MTFATAHNGGKTQINLQTVGFSGGFEFLNLYKTSQQWTHVSGGGSVDPTDCMLDVNGYPTVIPPGSNGIYRLLYITTQSQRPGNWVITWDGGGVIYAPFGTLVSGSKTSSALSTNNRYEFTMSASPTTASINVGIVSVTSTSDYPRNLKVFHIDDETRVSNGEIFGVEFKRRLAELGVGALRFLNWLPSNSQPINTWASCKPVDYVSYGDTEMRRSIHGGTTTNSGDDYSITTLPGYAAGSGAPVHNEMMIVKWSFTALTNTVTLNKDGTGALPVIRADGYPMVSFSATNTGRPGLNLHGLLVFNSALNSWLHFGNALQRTYLDNCVPPQVCFQLCAELGMHPYFAIPYLSCDPVTDIVSELATYCRDNAPAWMVPRYEGPNELWNGASGVYGRHLAERLQLLRNGGDLVSNPTYTATAMSWTGSGSTGVSTITLGTNTLPLGAEVLTTASGGSGPFGFNNVVVRVIEISVGGNPDVVKVNYAPTAGIYNGSSVVTLTPHTGSSHGWYGRVLSDIGQEVADVYGVVKAAVKTQSDYHLICGVQTTTTTSQSNERLSASSYVLNGGDAASDWVTHVACAQYITPPLYGTATETTLATAYAGGDLTAPETYIASLGGVAASAPSGGPNVAQAALYYAGWKTWAQGYGIQKMCGYEGGYSPDYTGSGVSQADLLRYAGKLVPELLDHDTQNSRNFLALTDGTFTAEFPSNYFFTGRSPSTNAWSILEDLYQTPEPPQVASIRLINSRKRRMRITT